MRSSSERIAARADASSPGESFQLPQPSLHDPRDQLHLQRVSTSHKLSGYAAVYGRFGRL